MKIPLIEHFVNDIYGLLLSSLSLMSMIVTSLPRIWLSSALFVDAFLGVWINLQFSKVICGLVNDVSVRLMKKPFLVLTMVRLLKRAIVFVLGIASMEIMHRFDFPCIVRLLLHVAVLQLSELISES